MNYLNQNEHNSNNNSTSKYHDCFDYFQEMVENYSIGSIVVLTTILLLLDNCTLQISSVAYL